MRSKGDDVHRRVDPVCGGAAAARHGIVAMMLRIGRTERFDCQIVGEGYRTYRVARRIPLGVIIELDGPWFWGLYRPGDRWWTRVSLGLVHISWAWKLPNW
jgi:hypothetical protein